jgi:hypothetical protein
MLEDRFFSLNNVEHQQVAITNREQKSKKKREKSVDNGIHSE